MKRSLPLAVFLFALHATAAVTVASHAAAVTSAPIATRVAVNTLREGGNAMDAAIAAQWTLAVVQPQTAGLGGGGLLLYFERKSSSVWALDFREAAPQTLPKATSGLTLRYSGVPGVVAGLGVAHERFAALPWAHLLEPAISLAHGGTPLGKTFRDQLELADRERGLSKIESTAAFWFPNAKPLDATAVVVQENLARTLTRISEKGPAAFYDSSLAKQLMSEMKRDGATITLRDLRDYKALWRAPLRIDFAEQQIYAAPPPSRAGYVLAEALGAIHAFDLAAAPLADATTIHLVSEIMRRAEADARANVADPARARTSYGELLSAERLESVAAGIDRNHAVASSAIAAAAVNRQASASSDIVVVDQSGNVALITTSLGAPFGSGWFSSGGFFLNSALRDFDAKESANSEEAGRRPASPLCPILVLHRGTPTMAINPGGGEASPAIALQLLIDTTIYGTTLSSAIEAPRQRQSLAPDELQYERLADSTLKSLNAMGHAIVQKPAIGAVEAITFDDAKIVAISDPRSEGAAGGY